jgi:tetratricopeptide (TPR) repeat protein
VKIVDPDDESPEPERRDALMHEENEEKTLRGSAERGSADPRQLLKEILSVAASRRETAARWERFRSLDLAEVLLEESERDQDASPARSRELAWTAQLVAEQAWPAADTARVHTMLARSRCLQGNALRLLGERVAAEVQFQVAVHYLTGPPTSAERACYCEKLASLREAQGRFDEAAALLWRAVAIHRAARRFEEQGPCLCRLAFLSSHEGQMEAAGRLFSQARGLLSFERSPGLAARCSLGYALCLAVLGETDQALFLRKESLTLADRTTDGRDLLDIEWLEGRLAAELGEQERAERHLGVVRRHLVQQGRLTEAALCSVDMAQVYVWTDREERIGELIEELQAAFPVSLDQVRMLVALQDFLHAVANEVDVEDAARKAVELIRRPGAILTKL